MTFKDLKIGQTFNFVSNKVGMDSFFEPCQKISPRKYTTDTDKYTIGSIKCTVYNVDKFEAI